MFHLHIIILASHMIRTSLQFWLATCYFSSDLKCVPPSLEVVQFLLQLLRILRPPPDQLLALWAQLIICLLMSTNVPSYTLQEEEKRLIMNAHRGVGGGRLTTCQPNTPTAATYQLMKSMVMALSCSALCRSARMSVHCVLSIQVVAECLLTHEFDML